MNDIFNCDKEYIANTYKRFPVCLKDGKGATVTDTNGKKYIDFGSGIAVNSFGYCDEKWVAAVTEQLGTLQHTSNLYYTEPGVKLAKLLCEKTGMRKVFFANSGAEANECAIKTARKYSFDKYADENRKDILSLHQSFHGRTLATLKATGQDVFHKYFDPFPQGFIYADANDLDSFKSAVNGGTVCAVMMELIQGEGGVNVLDADYVKNVCEYCDEHDILVIIDEVQTGNGRTGKMYAYEHFGIKPDLVTTAKGIAGGLPMGICYFGEKTENVLSYGDHGTTFGMNPVICAGALSVVERMDDEFLVGVLERSNYICDRLAECKRKVTVSGMGLMLGLETDKPSSAIANRCLEKGLLVLTAKTKVRLLPPLNISFEELKTGMDILTEVIDE